MILTTIIHAVLCLVCLPVFAADLETTCANQLLKTSAIIRDGLWGLEIRQSEGELEVSHSFGSLIYQASGTWHEGLFHNVYVDLETLPAEWADEVVKLLREDFQTWRKDVNLYVVKPPIEGQRRFEVRVAPYPGQLDRGLAHAAFMRLRAILALRFPDFSQDVTLRLQSLANPTRVFKVSAPRS